MTAVDVDITEEGNLDALLRRLDFDMRRKHAKKAVREGVKVVQAKARELAPESAKTGTREGWSKATRAKRAGVKSLKSKIKVVVREYDDNFAGITGPVAEATPLAHLVEFSRAKVLWGNETGETVSNTNNRFFRPAADQTKSEQRAAVVNTLRAGIKESGG